MNLNDGRVGGLMGRHYMVFDVESVGLHGEAFAVGWVVVDSAGEELESGGVKCPVQHADGQPEDRKWVETNVPELPFSLLPTPACVRHWFWAHYRRIKDKYQPKIAAEVPWPVEARFLSACVDDDPEGRGCSGPFPLLDIASIRFAVGFDPNEPVDRKENELPAHNPLCDARQSARLLIEALTLGSG